MLRLYMLQHLLQWGQRVVNVNTRIFMVLIGILNRIAKRLKQRDKHRQKCYLYFFMDFLTKKQKRLKFPMFAQYFAEFPNSAKYICI